VYDGSYSFAYINLGESLREDGAKVVLGDAYMGSIGV